MNKILVYLFSPLPGHKFAYYWPSLGLFLALLLAALVTYIVLKKFKKPALKKTYSSVPANLITFALIWGLLVVSRYENIAFFSMRALMFVTLLIMLYWGGKQIYLYFSKYKEESAKIDKLQKNPKYSFKKYR